MLKTALIFEEVTKCKQQICLIFLGQRIFPVDEGKILAYRSKISLPDSNN